MRQITFFTFLCLVFYNAHAQDLRITEIMYNPDNSDSAWEWVEVYNAGTEPVDLSGYIIDDNSGASYSEANIPSGTISSGKSAILFNASALSETEFFEVWGTVDLIPVTRWSSLNNGGDSIGIWNSFESYSGDNSSQENVIEQVSYRADGEVWPEDDGSASIYLTDLNADNNLGTNWSLSTVGGITPLFEGYVSSVFESNDGQDVGSPGLSSSVDTEKPTVTCPENIDMDADTDNCGSTFPFLIPTGTDNVTEELTFQGIRSDGLELTDVYPVGLTTIAWTATDEAGNVSEPCDQAILITDGVAPSIVCADTIEVLSPDGNSIMIAIEEATASNVCGGNVEVSGIRSDEKGLEEPFAVGHTTITWKATDDSGNVAECEQLVTVNFNASTENDITSFSVPNQLGETVIDVDNKTILITVPFGTDVRALAPIIEISDNASILPESGIAQDFSNPVEYTVIAQDGSEQVWIGTIEIEEEEEDVENDITSFSVPNQLGEAVIDVDNKTILITVPFGADISALVPIIEISENASILPESGIAQDFSNPVEYKVIAEDGSEQVWTVIIQIDEEEANELLITSFMLIDAETNEDLFLIEEGMIIDVKDLPTLHLDVRAIASEAVESIHISLGGALDISRTENIAPYALFGDSPAGNYYGSDFNAGTYELTATPYSEDNLRGEMGESLKVNFELLDEPEISVTGFMLVNADTNEDLFLLTEGMQIDIINLPTLHLDIRAITDGGAESVQLQLEGNMEVTRIENIEPYALYGDSPVGVYNGEEFTEGMYKVMALPYSQDRLGGEVGSSLAVNFELIDSSPVLAITGFTLVNADTNEDIMDLTDGQQIEVSSLPTRNLDVRANTTSDVESVKLMLSGIEQVSRTENVAPFALFGDFPAGNYNGNNFQIGSYNITANGYAANNLGGEIGESFSVDFELIDTQQSERLANKMRVYPNPASDEAVLQFETLKDLTVIVLYDLLGRVVETYSGKQIARGDNYVLDVTSIPEGSYYINAIDTNGDLYRKQIIVKK